MNSLRLLYKPYWKYILTDIFLLVISFFVVLEWFPLSTQIPFQKYDIFALVFSLTWVVMSYIGQRYVRIKYLKVGRALLRLLWVSLIVLGLMYAYMEILSHDMKYSIRVLLTIWIAMFVASIIYILFSHAYRYALNVEDEVERMPRGPRAVLKAPVIYDERETERCYENIVQQTSQETLNFLLKYIQVASSNTYTMNTSELYNVKKLRDYRFDAIVNFMPLNQIRGINKLFGIINDKLPDDGLFVCCYEPQTMLKKRIFEQYPPVINFIVYSCLFLYKRVMPRVVMTSRLYYDITEGKNRVLSRSEVLGRLCYCGFEIVAEQKSDNMLYVVARRAFTPTTVQRRFYGMFIRLDRVGKNGKKFKVYKFRTMHPYSEFLQEYIYKKYSLREGGKFKHDIRVTTIGRFMRRYWLDELPMLLNVLKGDMKLVGVRPLSQQYFSLYNKELQEKRVKHKPGLLPPFYADMPKTLEEIEASEMRYLEACEQKGTLRTDFVYFFKILYTIIFKRARSH